MAEWRGCAFTVKLCRAQAQRSKREFDLAAVENGARMVSSSDQFFGEPLNMLMPGLARNMGEGWETRRSRGPGHDWVIVNLAWLEQSAASK